MSLPKLRVLVPLAITTVALFAGVAVALTTYLLISRHVEENAEAETRRLAATLSRALVQPVLRNDIWQGYQLLKAASEAVAEPSASERIELLVIDLDNHVLVSPTPRQYPTGAHVSALPPTMARAAREVASSAKQGLIRATAPGEPSLILGTPILSEEGEVLAILLASHPLGISRAQRQAVLRQLSLLGLIAVLLVALAGGALGVRLTAPLDQLREAIQRAPRRPQFPPQNESVALERLSGRRDEIGDLARTFGDLLDQIAASQELERHVLEAERLASIGQLSAGIAHEVNNPLGGMLAAIENRRLRGSLDETTKNTLALLERGLRQIHESIQALLNEARREQRLLAPEDIHDLELLLKAEADHLHCRLDWRVEAPAGCNLPAVAVRQIVLNLALNALHAAGEDGAVNIGSELHGSEWQIGVTNTGLALDHARFARQCQGPESRHDGRTGLGLWITSRLLRTLGGRLELRQPTPPWQTELAAILPAPPTAPSSPIDRKPPDTSAGRSRPEGSHAPGNDLSNT